VHSSQPLGRNQRTQPGSQFFELVLERQLRYARSHHFNASRKSSAVRTSNLIHPPGFSFESVTGPMRVSVRISFAVPGLVLSSLKAMGFGGGSAVGSGGAGKALPL